MNADLPVAADLAPGELRDVQVCRDAIRAVVNVTSVRSIPRIFGTTRLSEAIGSGFIVEQEAHVVTNGHVVEGATRGDSDAP